MSCQEITEELSIYLFAEVSKGIPTDTYLKDESWKICYNLLILHFALSKLIVTLLLILSSVNNEMKWPVDN